MAKTDLKHLLLGLYRMSLSDGQIDPKEMALLRQIANENGVSDDELNEIVLDDNVEFYIPETLEEKVKLLYRFAQMAWADGIIADNERELLKQTAIRYGFLRKNAGEIADFFIKKVKEKEPIDNVIEEITK